MIWFGSALRPFYQQPLFGRRLAAPGVVVFRAQASDKSRPQTSVAPVTPGAVGHRLRGSFDRGQGELRRIPLQRGRQHPVRRRRTSFHSKKPGQCTAGASCEACLPLSQHDPPHRPTALDTGRPRASD